MISRILLVLGIALIISASGLLRAEIEQTLSVPKPSACVFSGEFTQQKTIAGIAQPLETSGVFLQHCKRGIIWQSTAPIGDILIVTSDQKMFTVVDGRLDKLNARAAKMIASVIKGLMSGDQAFIDDNFVLSKVAETQAQPQAIRLAPKERSLKRAIENVTISRVTSVAEPNQADSITITMLDKKGQITEIVAQEKMVHEEADEVTVCADLTVDALACQTLFTSQHANDQ